MQTARRPPSWIPEPVDEPRVTDPAPDTNPEPAPPARPCGLLRRLLIMLYDLLPVVATVMLAALVALPFTGDGVRLGLDPLYTLYVLAAWFAYLGLCWTRAGQTLGMRAWKVRIVDETGARPGWRAAGLRFAASWLSALPLGMGFVMSAFGEERMAWHDRLSGTRLVRLP